jgi:hypothetical protein
MKNHRFLLVNNKQGLGRFWKNNDFVVVDLYLVHINPSATKQQFLNCANVEILLALPPCPCARLPYGARAARTRLTIGFS